MMEAPPIEQSREASSLGAALPFVATTDMSWPTDRASRTAADEQRLRTLVDGHYDFVWRSLRGLGVASSSVDDATQQVFLIVARKMDSIALGRERAFLYSTARGVAANFRRSHARSRESLDDNAVLSHIDQAPGPEQLAFAAQAKGILAKILDAMDDDIRTVFVLFELEGLTTPAIAEILTLPPGTVASRLRRAREEFHAGTKRFRATQGGGQ